MASVLGESRQHAFRDLTLSEIRSIDRRGGAGVSSGARREQLLDSAFERLIAFEQLGARLG